MNSRLEETASMSRNGAAGAAQYVYVIGGDGGTLKIGTSCNPLRRLRDIKTNSGRFDLRVLRQWDCGTRAREMERRVHAALRDHRVGGEWFDADQCEVIVIVDLIVTESPLVMRDKGHAEDVVIAGIDAFY